MTVAQLQEGIDTSIEAATVQRDAAQAAYDAELAGSADPDVLRALLETLRTADAVLGSLEAAREPASYLEP